MKRVKSILAMLIAAVMVTQIIPINVFAEIAPGTVVSEDSGEEVVVPDDSADTEESNESPEDDTSEVADESVDDTVLSSEEEALISEEEKQAEEQRQAMELPEGVTENEEAPTENIVGDDGEILVNFLPEEEEEETVPLMLAASVLEEDDRPPKPVLKSIGYDYATVTTVSGREYSIDGGVSWQTDGTFSNLEPGQAYSIISRYAATEDEPASEISDPLETATMSQDTILVSSEEELRETFKAINIIYGKTYNICLQNAITFTDNIVFQQTRYKSKINFDTYGFTLDFSQVAKTPIIIENGANVNIGSYEKTVNVGGSVGYEEQIHGGTIIAAAGQIAVQVQEGGTYSSKNLSLTAYAGIENNGTIGTVSGGTYTVETYALQNNATIGDIEINISVDSGKYTSHTTIENNGTIGKLGGNFQGDFRGCTAIINQASGVIDEVNVQNPSYVYCNDQTFFQNYGKIGVLGGKYEASSADTIFENYGTVDDIAMKSASITTRWINLSHYKDKLGVVVNRETGVINKISSGNFIAYMHPLINYGTINEIAGGKFTRVADGYYKTNYDPEADNIPNYGTINDIHGGWYHSSAYNEYPTTKQKEWNIPVGWEEKSYFIVNKDSDASYAIRDGYQISYEPVTFEDGTDSGEYRVVGPSRQITWNMEGKSALLLLYGSLPTVNPRNSTNFKYDELGSRIDADWDNSNALLTVTDQYTGPFVGEYVVGENVPMYAFDHWEYPYEYDYESYPSMQVALNDYGILIVDNDTIQFHTYRPYTEEEIAAGASDDYKYNTDGELLKVSKTENADIYGYIRELWGAVGRENHKAKVWLRYDNWDHPSDMYNADYNRVANCGWKDQNGKLYVTQYPTVYPMRRNYAGHSFFPTPSVDWEEVTDAVFFDMPDEDLQMSIMYKVNVMENDALDQIWEKASRTTTSITLHNVLDDQIIWYGDDPPQWAQTKAEYSIDGGETWVRAGNKEGQPNDVVFENLSPNTDYDIALRIYVENTEKSPNAEDWIYPSEPISLCFDEKDPVYIKTYTSDAVIPDTLDSIQIGNYLYVEAPNGYKLYSKDWFTEDTKYYYNAASYYVAESIGSFEYPEIKDPSSWQSYSTWEENEFPDTGYKRYIRFTLYGGIKGTKTLGLRKEEDRKANIGPNEGDAIVSYLPARPTPTTVKTLDKGIDYIDISFKEDTLDTGHEYSIKQPDGTWSEWKKGNLITGLEKDKTYEIYFRLPATDDYAISKYAKKTITTCEKKADTPAKPELVSSSSVTIRVKEITGQEYSIDGGKTWQTSGFFNGLLPETEYQIITRVKYKNDVAASDPSEPLIVTTDEARGAPDTLPEVIDKTEDSITVKEDPDLEYSIDGGKNWQTDGKFDGLKPGHDYEIISRYPGTGVTGPSKSTDPITVTTEFPAPELVERTDTKIVVKADPDMEYSIDGGENWRTDGTFDNLQPGTDYEIIGRWQEDTGHNSDPLHVTTIAHQDKPATGPEILDKSDTEIIVKTDPDLEYSIDGGEHWQSDGKFDGLEPGKDYEIISRYPATDDALASPPSDPTQVTTKKPYPDDVELVPPVATTVTATTIEYEVTDGQEYALQTVEDHSIVRDWETTGIFTGLTPKTTYEMITRFEETDDYVAGSVGSEIIEVETKNKPAGGGGTEVPISGTHLPYLYGDANGTMRPESQMTRAEAASLFNRIYPKTARAGTVSTIPYFDDVQPGEWYYDTIQELASGGYLQGYPDGTFRPNDPISRAEYAALAVRFAESNVSGGEYTDFSDIATSWAKDDITKASNSGWIQGYPDGTFRPDENITRAEGVTITNRMLDRDTPRISAAMQEQLADTWPDVSPNAWYFREILEASVGHYWTMDGVQHVWTEVLQNG